MSRERISPWWMAGTFAIHALCVAMLFCGCYHTNIAWYGQVYNSENRAELEGKISNQPKSGDTKTNATRDYDTTSAVSTAGDAKSDMKSKDENGDKANQAGNQNNGENLEEVKADGNADGNN